MSNYSIEHSLIFNTAKRIFRFIAPDFRVIAREDIGGNECRLDLSTKILEVPEGQAFRAAGIIIFNAGLLKLRFDDKYPSVFGNIPNLPDDNQIVKTVAKEHANADEAAFRWAARTMCNYFPELDQESVNILVDHRLKYEEWIKYFSS